MLSSKPKKKKKFSESCITSLIQNKTYSRKNGILTLNYQNVHVKNTDFDDFHSIDVTYQLYSRVIYGADPKYPCKAAAKYVNW